MSIAVIVSSALALVGTIGLGPCMIVIGFGCFHHMPLETFDLALLLALTFWIGFSVELALGVSTGCASWFGFGVGFGLEIGVGFVWLLEYCFGFGCVSWCGFNVGLGSEVFAVRASWFWSDDWLGSEVGSGRAFLLGFSCGFEFRVGTETD